MIENVKRYFIKSSLHGLHFIAEPGRHWTERLFWLMCCLSSWMGSAMLMWSSWNSYVNNPISFVTESSYIEWITHFPSITVCQTDNILIAKFTKSFGNRAFDLEGVYRNLAFFVSKAWDVESTCFSFSGSWDNDSYCPKKNLSSIVKLFRSPCTEVFHRCYWNGLEFNCCREFKPLATEFGVCYSINNLNTQRERSSMSLKTNRRVKQPNITVELLVPVNVYVHSHEEVPSREFREEMFHVEKGQGVNYFFSAHEIESDPDVRAVSFNERKCRFPNENTLKIYSHYSYKGCIVQCRKKLQRHLCNCTSPLMPDNDPQEECDTVGIACLSKYSAVLGRQVSSWAATNQKVLYCPCLYNCQTMEIEMIIHTKYRLEGVSNRSVVAVVLYQLPTEKYRRTVVHGKLDLVVSMGGAVSLLVGSSLLSFMELIYYFSCRPLLRGRKSAVRRDFLQKGRLAYNEIIHI